MKKEKILYFQKIKSIAPMLVLVAGLASGCAPEVDQAERDINSPSAGLIRLGDQVRAHGDDNGAMEFYARAAQRDPDEPVAHARLAELLELQDMTTDAADQYRMLAALQPDNIEYRRAYGRVLVKLNRLAEGKEQYEAALKIDGKDTKSLNGLGVTLDLLGDRTGAEQMFKAALEQKPDDMIALTNLGHSYVTAGSYDKAIQLLEPHYKNNNAPKALRENLAEAYGMAGMQADAERILTQDLSPDEAKKNMDRIQAARATAAPAVLYANLGSLSTSELARARVERIKGQFADAVAPLSLDIIPEMEEAGKTPIFNVRASGFKTRTDADSFCKTLKKSDVFCKARGG